MHESNAPEWLTPLLQLVELTYASGNSLEEQDLKRLGLKVQQLGHWFKKYQQFSFDTYLRLRRSAFELDTCYLRPNIKGPISTGRKDLFVSLLARKKVKSDASSTVFINRVLTPLGPMVVMANSIGICLLEFADRRMLETNVCRVAKLYGTKIRTGANEAMLQLNQQLGEYFAGTRSKFEIPLADGGTPFQQSVWSDLKTIPCGRRETYSLVAQRVGKPSGVRAVGKANGDNRLAILIPCHRLVGSDGSLTGYGGGLDRKQWLLDHEQKF